MVQKHDDYEVLKPLTIREIYMTGNVCASGMNSLIRRFGFTHGWDLSEIPLGNALPFEAELDEEGWLEENGFIKEKKEERMFTINSKFYCTGQTYSLSYYNGFVHILCASQVIGKFPWTPAQLEAIPEMVLREHIPGLSFSEIKL